MNEQMHLLLSSVVDALHSTRRSMSDHNVDVDHLRSIWNVALGRDTARPFHGRPGEKDGNRKRRRERDRGYTRRRKTEKKLSLVRIESRDVMTMRIKINYRSDGRRRDSQDRHTHKWFFAFRVGCRGWPLPHSPGSRVGCAPTTTRPEVGYHPPATDPSAHHLTATHSATLLLDSLTASSLSVCRYTYLLGTHICTYACLWAY